MAAAASLWWRLASECLLTLGGLLGSCRTLGLWMLPLGLALIADDLPPFKRGLGRTARWGEGGWRRFRHRR
jgi:hypothetical protein